MLSTQEQQADDDLISSEYVSKTAEKPLRVVCYGSSSSKTPEKYLAEARKLGYILARRGHTCVNGAGSFGCMAATNAGAASGNGHIVGVIHEMWVVDGSDWDAHDAGAHDVFSKNPSERTGPVRQLIVAGGDDLQERKKLLVKDASAVVVLPGGPGTWDELWEMACAKQIGLSTLPIVCVNVDGFYENFRQMLARAHEDELTYLKPHEILHFEPTAEAAVRWIEQQASVETPPIKPKVKRRSSVLGKSSSFMAPPVGDWGVGNGRSAGLSKWRETGKVGRWALTFAAGLLAGIALASQSSRSKAY